MVGEIRDQETAQVAIQASLTGHMVLSTLHTSDAPSCVMRLLDMGIEPFLLNTTLTGILAQRLARKLCIHCKHKTELTSEEQQYVDSLRLPISQTYTASGCQQCRNTGYKGRTGIFELLEISHELRALLTAQPVFSDIYAQALKDGMKPLILDAAEKVNLGIISMQELIRVLL
jgi:type II secretory ATPase GspE/PulE/Tfp pilus assembly ATPase PilB-like protein